MKINKLPGTRGSFTAKTEKKTKMFVYQVNGTDEECQLYMEVKEADGFPATIDTEFGMLYYTSRNLGREAVLNVYTDQDGVMRIGASNQGLTEADELRTAGVSPEYIDAKIIAALNNGKYAQSVKIPATGGANIGNP